jgi:hypothetical protein
MLNFVVFFVFFALVSGCFTYSLWWAMGSPFYNNFGEPEYAKGRVFSFYGAWLAKRYKAKQDAQSAQFKHFYGHLEAGTLEYLQAHNEFYQERQNDLDYLKPLGLCLVCFATHVNNVIGITGSLIMYNQGMITGLGLAFYVLFFWSSATVISRKLAA